MGRLVDVWIVRGMLDDKMGMLRNLSIGSCRVVVDLLGHPVVCILVVDCLALVIFEVVLLVHLKLRFSKTGVFWIKIKKVVF